MNKGIGLTDEFGQDAIAQVVEREYGTRYLGAVIASDYDSAPHRTIASVSAAIGMTMTLICCSAIPWVLRIS